MSQIDDSGTLTDDHNRDVEREQEGVGQERGRIVGRYVLVEQLGHGGMGVVHKAYDPMLGRLVAIKLLHRRDSDEAAGRFRREAQAIAQLAHPNVVAVHDVGTIDGELFIAMEYVDGERLTDWLRAPERTREQVLDAFLQAASGLAAAHDVELVHRDFKPDNVLVGRDGRVRVADFGLARLQSDAGDPADGATSGDALSLAVTTAGAIIGTPPYMAPEQHRGDPIDARADQFAFCAAMYEALAGERPFRGESYQELAENIVSGRARPLPSHAHVPAWLRQLIETGLATSPDDRFASMHHIIAELTRDRVTDRQASLDGTTTTQSMLAAFPPPDDASIREAVDGLCARLESAWELKSRGDLAGALAIADEVAHAADQVDYVPLRAAAFYLLGNLQHRTGDAAAGRETLYRAARDAAVVGDDWQVANVWVFLTSVVGDLEHYEEADTLRRIAEVAIARVGNNAVLESRLFNNYGTVLLTAGRAADAARAFERAFTQRIELDGQQVHLQLIPLMNWGEALLETGDLDGARDRIEQALATCQRRPGVATPVVSARCHQYLGRIALAKGDPAEAREKLERARALWQRVPGRERDLAEVDELLAQCD